MPFKYEIEFTHKDASGNVLRGVTIVGSHRVLLSGIAGPLDVWLREIAPAGPGDDPKFQLTLTNSSQSSGPAGDVGDWPYEMFFTHTDVNEAVKDAARLAGSHRLNFNTLTSNLEVVVDELKPAGNLNPRLHLTLREKA